VARVINVNTDEVVKFTAKLEKLSRTALPNVVRKSLNAAAMDVKRNTLQSVTGKTFVKRSPAFFKRFSRVEFASGRDLNRMRSVVGMSEGGLSGGGDNFAVDNLVAQEHGGTIKGRSLIPTDSARIGGSRGKMVRKQNRISQFPGKGIVNPRKVRGRNRKERFVKSAIHAGKGGLVRGTFNEDIVFRVTSLRKTKSGTKVRTRAIYNLKKGRTIRVKPTRFMSRAADLSTKTLEDIYITEAKKRFNRDLR
jgi:hypothetical protein